MVGSVAVTPVVVGDGPDVAGADALLACRLFVVRAVFGHLLGLALGSPRPAVTPKPDGNHREPAKHATKHDAVTALKLGD